MAASRFHLQHEEPVSLRNIDKKRLKVGNLLIFSCFMMYMLSMATKGVFAAEVSYVKKMWDLTNVEIQFANTAYYVIYGLVQIFIFLFIKKINFRTLLVITVPISAVCAILMGTCTGIVQIWAYFGLTGAFQAGIYSGCNAILIKALPTCQLSKANIIMNLGYAVGTVIAFGLCGLCVSFDLWQLPYYILGGLFLISTIAFIFISKYALRFCHINEIFNRKLEDNLATTENVEKAKTSSLIKLDSKKKTVWFYVIVLTLSFIITALYYSLMSNVTLFLTGVHNLPEDIGIYVSIVAPVTVAIGPVMTISACEKHENFILEAIKFTAILIVATILLVLFYKVNMLLSLFLIIVYLVISQGVKSIALSVVTYNMRDQLNSGAYCALSNALASFAAGFMPTAVGMILDNFGWTISFIFTLVLAVIFILALIIINVIITNANKKITNQN